MYGLITTSRLRVPSLIIDGKLDSTFIKNNIFVTSNKQKQYIEDSCLVPSMQWTRSIDISYSQSIICIANSKWFLFNLIFLASSYLSKAV